MDDNREIGDAFRCAVYAAAVCYDYLKMVWNGVGIVFFAFEVDSDEALDEWTQEAHLVPDRDYD